MPAAALTAYRAEGQFISADGRTVRFNAALTAGDPGSNAALHQVPAIRAAVAAIARAAGASGYGVAGVAPAGYDVGQASDADLLHIIPVAIIVIGLLLALVMRSLIAPLYLIASVALSYLAAFGLSVLIFQPPPAKPPWNQHRHRNRHTAANHHAQAGWSHGSIPPKAAKRANSQTANRGQWRDRRAAHDGRGLAAEEHCDHLPRVRIPRAQVTAVPLYDGRGQLCIEIRRFPERN